ncbi:FAD-dependent oxidoreductase [Eggerthella sinensis]|uniref:FAD-dependent oxidoreductase n=1 Tax=Eggerthella sinensis TaxID=242230 RepID=UPI00266D5CC2|nr:FAD-binding protein [Eggerthella sinensis]
MGTNEVSRRAFLGWGATAAVAAGIGLTSCTPAASGTGSKAAEANPQSTTQASASEPAFLTPPEVPADVKEEKDCDVLVIGLGISGLAALKAAAEAGARVIGIDKQAELCVIADAGDFGIVNSSIQKEIGIEWAPKSTIVNQLMKDMCYRPNPDFLGYWYDHSGEDFDWYIEGSDFEILPTTWANKQTDKTNYIRPKCFPPLEGYDYASEYYPYFHGTITTNPNANWASKAAYDSALAAGAETMFATWADQLIVNEAGAVVGAYVRDADDVFTKINAKAVCLCTGDIGGSQEMRDYYVPWANEFACIYYDNDAKGVVANTGDGQRMGMWAGAHMELGPLAPMTHHMGGAMGINSYLQLNMEGKRFMNEDIPGQNIADQMSRQPQKQSWQIFDSKWPEQIAAMPDGHGYANHYLTDEEAAELTTVAESGWSLKLLGIATPSSIDEGADVKADTIEELAKGMGLPADVVKSEIERYNELCHQGIDEDYGKVPTRLFPVENPPYYAIHFDEAGMLVVMGGLECNSKLQPLDDDGNPIEGLFVAGNCMGGRFLVEYPVTVAGISLATALSFGRMAGINASGKQMIDAKHRA